MNVVAKEERRKDTSIVEPTPYCFGFKFAVPLIAAFIASLIAISQCQLAFETQYRYDWNVKNIKENGDGKTYSYNMWRGVYQVKLLSLLLYY